jgi:wobble nucleotide-excising tRNase
MIESISIASTATFGATAEVLNDLSQFNFVFGSNGTGKTTLSRVIADESAFPTCRVAWKSGTKLQAMVYNSDFVDRNFNQLPELKGVFTLGETQTETLTKIATIKTELDSLTKKVESLTQNLQGSDGAGGKKRELATLEETFTVKCWKLKQKYDTRFQGAFEGFRNSAKNFRDKVIQESGSNKATLLTLADLEKKAQTVFGQTPTTEQLVASVDMALLLKHESNPILKKRVIGRDDVNIAAMIRKLGNSDWVRQGRAFFDVNEGTCPFCQQDTEAAFAQSLNEYFDETFLADSRAIDALAADYAAGVSRIQQTFASILVSPSRFLDIDRLKAEKELFDTKVALNAQHLAEKMKEPSQLVELEPLDHLEDALKALVNSANAAITKHNSMVANLAKERKVLTGQVWRFLLEEFGTELLAYATTRDGIEKAIANMNNQIAVFEADKKKKSGEIRELEKQTTSIQPTIDGINGLLSSFGFQSFKLSKAQDERSYKLVRSDGTDAKKTLSEGEKNFVTFLYFYFRLKGSDTESGMTNSRLVVFDDPVSSLDSDVLFIVSSLVKAVFEEVRNKVGHIKQVFVLTHNVYFFREITFNPDRKDRAMNEETFWVVRKSGHLSKLEKHPTNPIKTSYDLLWAEVRKPGPSALTIQNTLRRILESYFKILGGVDPDKICAMFEGKEKLICKSLFSWVNAGSHQALDDLYVSIDEAAMDSYLQVFREIFRKSDHFAHYRMMMGDAFVEKPAPAEA